MARGRRARRRPARSETIMAATRLQLAQALYRQNKLIEAELEVRRALVDFLRLQGVDGPKTAHTVLILADILQAQGRYKDAQRLAEIGARHSCARRRRYRGPCRGLSAHRRRPGLARPLGRRDGDLREAQDGGCQGRRRAPALSRHQPRSCRGAGPRRPGRAGDSDPRRRRSSRRPAAGEREYAVAEATGFLGAAQAAADRDADAMRTLRAVIPVLLTTVNTAAKEEGAGGRGPAPADDRRRLFRPADAGARHRA